MDRTLTQLVLPHIADNHSYSRVSPISAFLNKQEKKRWQRTDRGETEKVRGTQLCSALFPHTNTHKNAQSTIDSTIEHDTVFLTFSFRTHTHALIDNTRKFSCQCACVCGFHRKTKGKRRIRLFPILLSY